MGTPKNAITLYEEAEPKWRESKKGKELMNMGFTCQGCGHRGLAKELLADPDDDGGNTPLWCPICETTGWTWD